MDELYDALEVVRSHNVAPTSRRLVISINKETGKHEIAIVPGAPLKPSVGMSGPAKVTWTTVNAAVNGFTYDPSGNVLFDGANYYSYDAESRVWAVETQSYDGPVLAFGYIYDAEGRRVAKGTITPSPWGQPPSCNPSSNGFTLTQSYVLGQAGEQLTTLTWNGSTSAWARTNVYGDGKLLATYDTAGQHFQLADPLGTRRMQTNAAGEPELDCQSL